MPTAIDATLPLPGLSPVAGKPIIARFDGGSLSSDGGLLALREVEARLGVAVRLAGCIDDPRAPERIQHSLAEMLRFRLLMIAAGYEDGNDADSLRHDPLFKLANGRLPDAAALTAADLLEIHQPGQAAGTRSRKVTLGTLRRDAVTALTIATGVVNVDCALGDFFTLSLTANVTSLTFSNLPATGRAMSLAIRIRQDATGGRTLALPASFKGVTGTDTAVQSAANAWTLLTITTFDQGTRWEYTMRGVAA
jgi:hypothetical protein